ncbi:hypothetical protein [Deinococcus peraridilitoris]|uniref:Uncharacterized protein n=1 Tax=Deinococcus peraridilitoris (strain DSM 19664 / LMG 22246 / CIP 109416 / KR-200) TaxID=937777 RepID=K9ZX87_DEIPD|nr:hypothetical protein [Deinococcus peraridilitoris]AFZ66176.1 hypothetical protein Deipe_0585 [Deinococcus peraridilitoris DSM 19664]
MTLVECHQGVPVGSRGRLYLQYAVRGASPFDVWVFEGPGDLVDLKRAVVTLRDS